MSRPVITGMKDQSAEMEEIISELAQMYQNRADELTRAFFNNAQKRASSKGRKCFVTMTSARSVVLAMVRDTEGEILRW